MILDYKLCMVDDMLFVLWFSIQEADLVLGGDEGRSAPTSKVI